MRRSNQNSAARIMGTSNGSDDELETMPQSVLAR